MKGFSWKRAVGITGLKQKIAKKTGIPTTKAGRKRKAQNLLWKALFGKKQLHWCNWLQLIKYLIAFISCGDYKVLVGDKLEHNAKDLAVSINIGYVQEI